MTQKQEQFLHIFRMEEAELKFFLSPRIEDCYKEVRFGSVLAYWNNLNDDEKHEIMNLYPDSLVLDEIIRLEK